MRITLAAIGKATRSSPESQLFEQYLKRLPWKLALKELEDKKSTATARRKEREAELLLGACEGHDRIVALDEKGAALTSVQFARQLQDWQNQSASSVAFVIGGADGLHASVLQRSNLVLSFGTMTWPHLLVRALLAEQLYRAQSILSGHPYHRE